MSHYVVGYHDLQNNHYEICEYADDAYNAIKQEEDLLFLLCWQKVLFLVNTVLRRINEELANQIILYYIWCYYIHTCHTTPICIRIDNTNNTY